eukprot:GHVL01042483.1.p1 GENE.GHVL01042483.1~~GHVL01042483.1.p1  ORF type:complete len:114 (+),score=8.20 GHVL01042483.1:40-381(+)
MAQRVHYRRHNHYNTKSNRVKKVRTPGGRLVLQHVKKFAKVPKCGDTGAYLNGITAVRPYARKRLTKVQKTVSRVYGGCLSANAVKQRILRSFLVEEQRCVKAVLAQKDRLKA